MTRNEFISELKIKLKKMPFDEVTNAINYYEEYFDEAGEENEQTVITELVSPSSVASKILGEFAIKDFNSNPTSAKKGISAIWIIILGIFASPIAIPLAISVCAIAISLVITLFALILSIAVSGIAVVSVGIVCLYIGLMVSVTSVSSMIFFFGTGLALIGAGFLLIIASAFVSKIGFKFIIKTFSNLLRRKNNEDKYAY